MTNKVNIDWNNLGFEYIKTDFRYISTWKDGKWDEGHLTEEMQQDLMIVLINYLCLKFLKKNL